MTDLVHTRHLLNLSWNLIGFCLKGGFVAVLIDVEGAEIEQDIWRTIAVNSDLSVSACEFIDSVNKCLSLPLRVEVLLEEHIHLILEHSLLKLQTLFASVKFADELDQCLICSLASDLVFYLFELIFAGLFLDDP